MLLKRMSAQTVLSKVSDRPRGGREGLILGSPGMFKCYFATKTARIVLKIFKNERMTHRFLGSALEGVN